MEKQARSLNLTDHDSTLQQVSYSYGCLDYDCPLGDDLLAYIKARLATHGVQGEISEPIREDAGSTVLIRRDEKVFAGQVDWLPSE